jgi:riboflavin kinase/FMN adenylyltransferase
VLTFEPHRARSSARNEPSFHLTSEAAKLRLLAATGSTERSCSTSQRSASGLSAEELVERILVDRLAINDAVIGFNFHFGKARRGTPDFLMAQGRPPRLSPSMWCRRSSTRAGACPSGASRDALAAGHVPRRPNCSGYPWFVTAQVVHGDKRGRTLGYPDRQPAARARTAD